MDGQENLIWWENEQLVKGKDCVVLAEDNHQAHIEGHRGLGENVERHVLEHRECLKAGG